MRIGLIVVLIGACGCGTGGTAPAGGSGARSARAHAKAAAAPAANPGADAPAANAPLPKSPSKFADALATTTRDLDARVHAWLGTHPAEAERPPEPVALDALYQQRLYRYMRRHPSFGLRVIAALPARLRSQARDNYAAGRSLLALSPKKRPKTQPPIHTGSAEAPQRLLGWYRAAQKRFGVRWQILAAVNLVESDYNRLRNNSYAGAQGPMQFIPSTWNGYGLGGDIRDPHDAIMGAANYLHASGAPGSDRAALYHYNPSRLYVDAIIRYARQMQRRPERFYAYWSWQVFVRDWKTGADKRLTGPGL